MTSARVWIPALLASVFSAPSLALPFFFSTGDPDGRMAMASRPDNGGKLEIEQPTSRRRTAC
jgi:hypothetical protein